MSSNEGSKSVRTWNITSPRGLFIMHLRLLDVPLEEAEKKADKAFTPALIKRSKHDRRVLKFYNEHGINLAKQALVFKQPVEDCARDLLLLSDCGMIPKITEMRTL